MRIPVRPIVFVLAGFVALSAQAQLLGPTWESNISLKQEDIDIIHQTVNQNVHGKATGTTASWSGADTGNSGTIKLLKKFTVRSMQCEEVGYTIMTSTRAVPAEHYVLRSCLQSDGTWKII